MSTNSRLPLDFDYEQVVNQLGFEWAWLLKNKEDNSPIILPLGDVENAWEIALTICEDGYGE